MSPGTSDKDDWWAGVHSVQGHVKRVQFVQSTEKKAKKSAANLPSPIILSDYF